MINSEGSLDDTGSDPEDDELVRPCQRCVAFSVEIAGLLPLGVDETNYLDVLSEPTLWAVIAACRAYSRHGSIVHRRQSMSPEPRRTT